MNVGMENLIFKSKNQTGKFRGETKTLEKLYRADIEMTSG
jgi:hypothetical protein